MTEKVRMPADLGQVTLKLLGKFNAKDLARIGLPITAAFAYVYTASNPSSKAYIILVAAVVFGGVWALWRPYGRTLDQNLYQCLRWMAQRGNVATPKAENGYIVSDGSLAALIEVNPINLKLKSGSEKAALHRQYQELLQTVDYPVSVYSTQQSFSFEKHFNDLDSEDELQKDYRDYCKGLIEEGQSSTRHFIEVHVENEDEAELENRVDEVLEQLNSGGLTAERTGEIIENRSSPEIVHDHVNCPEFGERSYSKTLYISEYPGDVDFSWTKQILQVEGLVDVVQVVEPKSAADTVSTLQKLENKAEVENQSLVRKGYGSSRRLERLLDDVDWFQNLLADQNDQPVGYGVYITVHSSTLEECEDTLRSVENRLRTLGINYKDTSFRTDQAYQTSTLGLPDKLDERVLVPAGSAASGFPFTLPSTVDETGVLYGVEDDTQAPVILDRFKWNAGHVVHAGATGSGKSFHSKLLLLRSAQIYDNLHINIVDPKPEYREIAERLRQYAEVNLYTSEASISEDKDGLIDAVEQAYREAQDTDEKTIVVVDEAHRLLKKEEGASILSTLVREARSSNTAVTLITQTVGDFTRTADGADILKNIPGKLLYSHEDADKEPGKAFQLSTVAETRLYNLAKGDEDATDYSQAILSVTNQFESEIKIEASPQEKAFIDDEPVETSSTETKRFESSYSDNEESSWVQNTKTAIVEAICGVDKPSLPDFSSSLDELRSSSSQPSNGGEEERSSPNLDSEAGSVYASVKSGLEVLTVLALLVLGIGVVSTVGAIVAEGLQIGGLSAGPVLFILIIGGIPLHIVAGDVYSSREDSVSDYTLKRIIAGTAIYTVAFSIIGFYLIGIPLSLTNWIAQAVPPGRPRIGFYGAAAILELAVIGKVGENEEDTV